MQSAEVGRSSVEHLDALQKQLAKFEERLKTPLTVEDTKAELAALKEALGVSGSAAKTAGATAAEGSPVEDAATASPSPAFDPAVVAGVLIERTHDAKSAVELLEAKGAVVIADANGAPMIRAKDGSVMSLAEGLTKLLPEGMLRPVGHAGSGGKGGSARPVTHRQPAVSMIEQWEASGRSASFYAAHRDQILKEKYGRAPMTRLK